MEQTLEEKIEKILDLTIGLNISSTLNYKLRETAYALSAFIQSEKIMELNCIESIKAVIKLGFNEKDTMIMVKTVLELYDSGLKPLDESYKASMENKTESKQQNF